MSTACVTPPVAVWPRHDVAVMGARVKYLTASFILEEGLPLADLERIVDSMAAACAEAGVQLVAADTKVTERGKSDGLFISTTGIGWAPASVEIAGSALSPGMSSCFQDRWATMASPLPRPAAISASRAASFQTPPHSIT